MRKIKMVQKLFFYCIFSFVSTGFGGLYGISLATVQVEARPIVKGLNHPWAVVLLEPGRWLITERGGGVKLIDELGNKSKELQVPARLYQRMQGGLLDLEKHPQYVKNGWVYLTYSKLNSLRQGTTALARFKIVEDEISHWQELFVAKPYSSGGRHFGSRIVFDEAGFVYITIGDRGDRLNGQALENDLSSVIRLHDDGRLPADNPFVENPHIYSYGHRNSQGFVYDQGRLWLHEHGPRGGDELNIIERGMNYGWPLVSFGREYTSSKMVGVLGPLKGMEQPVYQWTPSIAPSGMGVYRGQVFPEWEGHLLVGSLKFSYVSRLVLDESLKVVDEVKVLGGVGRIRDIYIHTGRVFVLTDERNGQLLELVRSN